MSLSNLIIRRALFSLLVVVCCRLVSDALRCPGCPADRGDCPSVVGCPGGTLPDSCGCCLECARVANQSCGGRYRSEGKCDDGLVCVISPPPGAVITGEEVGICRGIIMTRSYIYWINMAVMCLLVAPRVQMFAGGALDGRIVRCSTISLCQLHAGSEIVKRFPFSHKSDSCKQRYSCIFDV